MTKHGDFHWTVDLPPANEHTYIATHATPSFLPCPYCNNSTQISQRVTSQGPHVLLQCHECRAQGVAFAPHYSSPRP